MNMKKLIATALAVVMIFGLVSVGFAAAEFPDIEDHKYASSIEKPVSYTHLDVYKRQEKDHILNQALS